MGSHSQVTEILGAIASWCGATVAVLSILDWLLSERQKAKVNGWLETTWLFLSYREPKNIEDLILTPIGQLTVDALSAFFASSLLGLVVHGIAVSSDPIVLPSIGLAYWAGTATGAGFVLVYMRWLSTSRDFRQYKSRSENASMIAVLSLVCLLFLSKVGRAVPDDQFMKFVGFFFALLFVTLAAAGIVGFVAYWRPITWFLRGSMCVLQFVIRRIVEYPKGPVLGLSGLLMAIGALIKIFGS